MQPRNQRRTHRRDGFTLIEVLLVLIILVVLGGIVGVNVNNAQKSARINAAKAQVRGFSTPLNTYQLAIGSYPSTSAGLDALINPPGELRDARKWDGPYMEKAITEDPWGNPYQYAYPGSHNSDMPDVWSLGPDGADGTEDDIGNWDS